MIDTDEKLAPLLPRLRAAKWIALDTEADSLHAYPEKLCLLQISIEGEDALLDPLSAVNLAPALEIFHDHELIFHAADYDLRLMQKTWAFRPTAIFDTMLASRLLGFAQFGLGNLVEQCLGVKLEKGPQKADWARRPLTERMEIYARNDTRYLKPLADILRKELVEKGRLAWHQESCARLIEDCSVIRPPDPNEVWRVKGSHVLTPPELAVLREIWHWRETEATLANRPPFFILSPETMVGLSQAAVLQRDCEPLLPRRFSPRRVGGVLRAIEAGLKSPDKPQRPRISHDRPTEAERQRFRDLEKHRDRHATELHIDPTIIASRATLLALARNGAVAGEVRLMKWQQDLLK